MATHKECSECGFVVPIGHRSEHEIRRRERIRQTARELFLRLRGLNALVSVEDLARQSYDEAFELERADRAFFEELLPLPAGTEELDRG
jgi:hypothetical protein